MPSGADDLTTVRVTSSGDAALVLEFPARIDPAVNEAVTSTAAEIRTTWGTILRDVVIGFSTVTVYYDPLRIDADWLEGEIWRAAERTADRSGQAGALVEVPVCYDPSLAPDLDEVAAFAGCPREEVVTRHAGRQYRVYMVGFLPGFAYLAEVDPRIAAPRKAVPRALVPGGSVGIAGGQTGIYPADTPGGWNIIGRTPLRPWDPERAPRFLLRPGDTVQFVAISRAQFDRSA